MADGYGQYGFAARLRCVHTILRNNRRPFKMGLPRAYCQVPGASIAAIAGAHGMNANVLHLSLIHI